MDTATVDIVLEGLLAIIGIGIGWFLVSLRNTINLLRSADERLRQQFDEWRVEVARDYVRRDEIYLNHRELMTAINRVETKFETRIDRVEENKADK